MIRPCPGLVWFAGEAEASVLAAELQDLNLSDLSLQSTTYCADVSQEALSVQLSELSFAAVAETDLSYAFALQVEEALQASLLPQLAAGEAFAQLPQAEQPSDTYTALQSQVWVAIAYQVALLRYWPALARQWEYIVHYFSSQ